MKSEQFNRDYQIDRRSKGVKAMPKHATAEPVEVKTADGTAYDAGQTYHFFDEQTQAVRQSIGLRRSGEHLCTFGLRVVEVAQLHTNRNEALSAGQQYFNAEIERLRERVRQYETEKAKQ